MTALGSLTMTAQRKMLLCDDDPDILEVTSLLFTMENYHVRTLSHLGNLFAVIQQFTPDIILMDLRMPDLGGAKATQLLKAHPTFKHIPIFIYSADSEVQEIAKSAHADGFFVKPFDIDELVQTINRLLEDSKRSEEEN